MGVTMEKKTLATTLLTLVVFSLFFTNSALASLTIQPAKLGILRLTISPFFPAKATGSFEIKNTYNYSISVNLTASKNITDIISLSENSFSLGSNETKEIAYMVTVTEPGNYVGNIEVLASSGVKKAKIGYQVDLAVIARKSNLDSTVLIGGAVLVAAVASTFVYFKKFKKRKTNKKMIALAFCFASLLLLSSNVLAANIAMVVKDATALSPEHEEGIYNILANMGHNVTLVDKNIDVNYYDYNLIVIAGRPLSSSGLDDFVANIPVNNIPTIGIDYSFLDNWGWVGWGGRSSYGTSQMLKLYIQSLHPITVGFSPGTSVDARTVVGYKAVDMIRGGTSFTFVATVDAAGQYGLIAYAPPKTQLANNKRIADDSAAVFIGVNYPIYWTEDMKQIFENSVNWLLNLEYEPPTIPTLTGPSTAKSSATYTWTASSDTSGIQYYQFQLSKNSDFSPTVVDVDITGLQYISSGLKDGTKYYAKVRAVDNVGVPSEWSNVITTVSDSSNIILKINSPTEGTVLHLSDAIDVDVDVAGSRVPDGSICTITIGGNFIANMTYDKSIGKCSDSVIIPATLDGKAIGATSFTVSVTNSVGSTNSTSVAIFMDRALTVTVSTDKSSYSTSETVQVSGYVKISDNNAAVEGATVTYNVSGTTGNKQTNSNGKYSFDVAGLSSGSYTLDIKANYNGVEATTSTSFTVTSSTGTTNGGSGGGSWGGAVAPILDIEANNVEVFENTESTFTIKVKNGGTALIHGVKVSLLGTNLTYTVDPSTLVDLDLGKSQEYKITLNIPDNSTGQSKITIKALGYETARTKIITLTVLPKILAPVLQAVSIELPTFYEDEASSINITIQNTGNLTATATASISLPENWTAVSLSEALEIKPGEQQKFSFVVIPSNVSGPVKFDVSYLVNGQEKKFSESAATTVNSKPEKEEEPQTESMTGMIVSTLLMPQVYVPATAGVTLVLIYLFKEKISSLKGLSQIFGYKKNALTQNVLTTPTRKINPASSYLRWERRYAKK
jgi:hypothetical protein